MFSAVWSMFGTAPSHFQVQKGSGFQDVAPAEDKLFSNALSKGSSAVTYRARGQYYEANLDKMEQRNIGTGRVRKLRQPATWLEDNSGTDNNVRTFISGHSSIRTTSSERSSKLSEMTSNSRRSQQTSNNRPMDPHRLMPPPPMHGFEGLRACDSARAPAPPSPRGVRKVPPKTAKAKAGKSPPPYPYGASGAAILAGSEICTAVAAALVGIDFRTIPTPPQKVYKI